MKKYFALALFAALMGVAVAPAAEARDNFSVHIGGGGFYGPYYGGGYYAPYYAPYAYGYPGYYAPAPTVVYQQPAETEIITAAPAAPQPAPVVSQAPAPQSVPTYIDSKGRTCRQFQSVMDGASVNGTACLQPDGSWRTVGE